MIYLVIKYSEADDNIFDNGEEIISATTNKDVAKRKACDAVKDIITYSVKEFYPFITFLGDVDIDFDKFTCEFGYMVIDSPFVRTYIKIEEFKDDEG